MRKLLITTLVTIIMSYILPGIMVQSFMSALLFAFILGITNGIVGKIIKTLGCLLTFITLGLFNLFVNGAMVLLADSFVDGVYIDGFLTAIILSIVISLFATGDTEVDRNAK